MVLAGVGRHDDGAMVLEKTARNKACLGQVKL